MGIKNYINLIRIRQWYKNLVIFLPIFFVEEIFVGDALLKTLLGFISLSLISSSNYVINDIIDAEKDRNHPLKKNRPVASKKISVSAAWILSIIFFVAGILLAYSLNSYFTLLAGLLFVLTLAYTLFLKKEPVLDVLIIAVNFVVRAVSGAFIINVFVSPWLIICPFFLALFLAVSKRYADLRVMKDKARSHSAVLEKYTPDMITALMHLSLFSLITSYSLYSFSKTELMLITIPFSLYTIFRYYSLTISNPYVALSPEKALRDWRFTFSIVLWIVITFGILYLV